MGTDVAIRPDVFILVRNNPDDDVPPAYWNGGDTWSRFADDAVMFPDEQASLRTIEMLGGIHLHSLRIPRNSLK